MPIPILGVESLGTWAQIEFIVLHFSDGIPRRIADSKAYCLDHGYRFAQAFDGIVRLLEFIDVIRVEDGQIVLRETQNEFAQSIEKSGESKKHVGMALLNRLRAMSLLEEVFPIEGIRFDLETGRMGVVVEFIPLKFFAIKHLAVELEILAPKLETPSLLLISPIYEKLFGSPTEEELHRRIRTVGKFSQEALLRLLERNALQGAEAEDFVLRFERARLGGHPRVEQIRIIGRADVRAGYDIVSYESAQSLRLDRFIEVKSFSRDFGFFWSRNEVEVARVRGPQYFLYLVDVQRMGQVEYAPEMIRNPYGVLFESPSWTKDVESWYLSPAIPRVASGGARR